MSAELGRHRVLVAGGGVAGLEALIALHDLAGEHVSLTLLAPERQFSYRPMAVAVPFARGRVQRHDLADVARHVGAEIVSGELAGVDPANSTARTTDGRTLAFDSLVVAVGAGAAPTLQHARTWTPELDQEVFGGLLADLEEGYVKRVAFVIPPNVAWPLPAYELALMTAWDARDMGQDDVQVTVYTPEEGPLAIFGSAASDAVRSDLATAGVGLVTGVVVTEAGGRLTAQPGDLSLEGQSVIALPRAQARSVEGLPTDESGFVLVDEHGRVAGTENVWAAGDAIAYPIKQGGLAAQQADAAAQSIAAAAGADIDPQPFHAVLRGVLLTGRDRHWIRRDLEDSEGEDKRHALWWPPTKVAGRYLAPYLAAADETPSADPSRPDGTLVEFTPEGHGL